MIDPSRIAVERFKEDACTLTEYDDELEVLTKDFVQEENLKDGQNSVPDTDKASLTQEQAETLANAFEAKRARTIKLELARAQLEQEVTSATKLYELPEIWGKTKGKDIKIAILDNGINKQHPALCNAVIDWEEFAFDIKHGVDMNGTAAQRYHGHGTHCAGIIAARKLEPKPNDPWQTVANIVDFTGLAPEALLLDAKVMHADGSGQLSVVAQGVQWAINNKADIISMSIQARNSSDALYRAIQRALENGVLVICGAGNYGRLHRTNIGYPGRYGGVVTVASHNRVGASSDFSATGGEIDVSAPGQGIWSTVPDGFGRKSGTSMAAPFVAGVAALILAKHRQIDELASAIARELKEFDQAQGTCLTKAWKEHQENKSKTDRIDHALILRLFDHVADRRQVASFRESISQTLTSEQKQAFHGIISMHDGDVVYNRTPVRNTEDLKEHLLAIAAHPGAHNPHSGYGALWPAMYFGVGNEAVNL